MRTTTLGKQLVAIAVASFAMLSVQDASPQASQRINPDLERFASQCKVGDGDGCAKLADLARHDKDWQVRQAAIARLTDQVVLTEIATRAAINTDRKLAAGRLTDQAILAEITKSDHDSSVQARAVYKLTDHAVLTAIAASADLGAARDARKRLDILRLAESDQAALAALAKKDSNHEARRSAVAALTDTTVFADVARSDYDASLRLVPALQKLGDGATLADVARVARNPEVGLAAVERIVDQRILADVAKTSRTPEVRRRAVEKLTDGAILRAIATDDDAQAVRRAARRRLENLGG